MRRFYGIGVRKQAGILDKLAYILAMSELNSPNRANNCLKKELLMTAATIIGKSSEFRELFL